MEENMTKTENTNQTNKKGIVIFAVVLVVLIGIFTAVYFVTRPAAQSGQKTVTIQVDPGEYGESTTYTVETDEEYLARAGAGKRGNCRGRGIPIWAVYSDCGRCDGR